MAYGHVLLTLISSYSIRSGTKNDFHGFLTWPQNLPQNGQTKLHIRKIGNKCQPKRTKETNIAKIAHVAFSLGEVLDIFSAKQIQEQSYGNYIEAQFVRISSIQLSRFAKCIKACEGFSFTMKLWRNRTLLLLSWSTQKCRNPSSLARCVINKLEIISDSLFRVKYADK